MTKSVIPAVATLALLVSLLACSQSGKETVKDAEDDLFAVHDEIMPKMDDLMRLRKQLRQRVASYDSLKAAGSVAATIRTDDEKEQAVRIIRDLTVADSLMMGWMGGYNNDTLAKLSPDAALRYLAQQKDLITDVKSKFNNSLDEARQFLDKK